MSNYFVVAAKYDEKVEKQIKVIVGQFKDFVNAKIFMDAYNKFYSTDAKVVSEYEVFN